MDHTLRRARDLRSRPTDAEWWLWQSLRLRQFAGYRFRRQHPLPPYIVDFVCLERRLIVEVDGAQHAEQVEYDAVRDAWLRENGFRVLRFTNAEVLSAREAVEQTIWEALHGTPRANPSTYLGG